jgi:hypothetical protein
VLNLQSCLKEGFDFLLNLQGGGTAPRLLLEAFEDPPLMYVWEKDPQMMEVCQVAFGADDLAEGGYIRVSFGV